MHVLNRSDGSYFFANAYGFFAKMVTTLTSSSLRAIAVAILGAIIASGCSGRPKNIARSVVGKVTLGGQPLAGARIVFTPAGGGSASFGKTDDTGSYKMVWAQLRGRPIEGAQVGEHTVQISTYQEADPDSVPPVAAAAEKVPFKYRQEAGNPKVTVNKGSNTIDIALEPGPVEPPQPKGKGKKAASPDCY